jgi:CheY-like chemotaxis protein
LARKILLADDSVTAQNMGRRILSDAGYDVTTVNNGSAALKKIAESKPDLIVLDVYMPGYGGLEVCQRLREAPETARIPVLLTVGKLEPFKAEESRRVRADGFIVKPFEASELLTALTKLEDKIVPQSQPAKPSRFARALAEAEEPPSGKEFDDSETGWKNRLSIPPPHSKSRGAAPAELPAAVASVREAARPEEQKPAEIMKSGLEEALLSSLPHDVTPEEIAAIKAAAAAFNSSSDDSTFAPHRDQVQAPTQEPVAIAEERPRESASEMVSGVAQAEFSATAGQMTTAETAAVGDIAGEAVPPLASVAEQPPGVESQFRDAETGKLAVDEVTAALASLAPANGHGDVPVVDREADQWDVASRDRVPVTMAVAGAAEEFNGPRWIAELVPVREDESTLVLEQEMDKAYAAFAAADAACMSIASSPDPTASLQGAEAPGFNSEAPYSPVEPFSNSDRSESQSPDPAEHSVATGGAQSEVPQAESTEAASPIVDAISNNVVSEPAETAAFAAAASASPGTVEVTMDASATAPPAPSVESSETAAPGSESASHGESELAVAWANWRQVRESVVSSQIAVTQLGGSELTSQIAETVAEVRESSGELPAESQVNAAPATEEETSDISNIVDSVLADLKPKLMAEIAKKMGKDKKK